MLSVVGSNPIRGSSILYGLTSFFLLHFSLTCTYIHTYPLSVHVRVCACVCVWCVWCVCVYVCGVCGVCVYMCMVCVCAYVDSLQYSTQNEDAGSH